MCPSLDDPVSTPPLGYDPGTLEPQTSYTLEVRVGYGQDEHEDITVSFHTGDGPGTIDPEPIQWLDTMSTSDWDHFDTFCQAVIQAQDCYDEGQDTHVMLRVDRDSLLYLVTARRAGSAAYERGVLWPGVCGHPSHYGYRDPPRCYQVHAVGPAGEIMSTEEACWPEPATGDPGLNETGTSTTGNEEPGATQPDDAVTGGGCACSIAATPRFGTGRLFALLGMGIFRRRRGVPFRS